jgi:GNAT superfamily N-acetyltransferase
VSIETRLFQDRDEPAVVELLQAAFGEWPREIEGSDRGEFFRWKHSGGPFGRSIGVVALVEEAIVGFFAYLPWLLRSGTQTVRTMRVVDLAVHPQHRGVGAPARMIAEGRRHLAQEIAFIWSNPNELSYARALQTGQGRAGIVPRFVGLGTLRYGTLARTWRASTGAAVAPPVEAASAARVLGEDGAEQLLEARHEAASNRLRTAIDIEYLRWRYGHFDEYRAVSANGDPASGIAIFRARRSRRGRLAQVCELLVPANDHRARRDLLKQVRCAAPVEMITCVFPSSRDAVRCGFLKAPGGTVLTVRAVDEPHVPDPSRAASWALSLGDLELV